MPARVNADDPAHPILKGVPATFVAPINEWYSWTPSPRANPDVKVLLTLDGSNFPLGVKNTLNGGDIPVATRTERAGAAARERASRGVRGAEPLG